MELLAAPKSRTASVPHGEAPFLFTLISGLARAFGSGYGLCIHNYL